MSELGILAAAAASGAVERGLVCPCGLRPVLAAADPQPAPGFSLLCPCGRRFDGYEGLVAAGPGR